MSDNEALRAQKEKEKAALQTKKSQYEKDIRNLDNKIALLQTAKKSINNDDNTFKDYVKKLDKLLDEKRSWAGKSKKDLIDSQGAALVATGESAQKRINTALDTLNLKLADLREERNRKYGLLGDVISKLDSVITWLENWVNDL